MQRFAKYTLVLLLGLASCDKGFEQLNTNPNASVKPNVDYLFSQSILKGNYVYDRAYFYTSYLTCGNYVQHFATAKELAGAGSGDKYGVHDQYQSFYFRYTYTNVLTTLKELDKAATAPEFVNKEPLQNMEGAADPAYHRPLWRCAIQPGQPGWHRRIISS
jgi:hypothetical protein